MSAASSRSASSRTCRHLLRQGDRGAGGGRLRRRRSRGARRSCADGCASWRRGAVDLSRLPAEADGELVHVAGKVRALGASASGVYRRVVFSFDGATRVVHETAEDFWLVGDGEPVLVEVGTRGCSPTAASRRCRRRLPRVRDLESMPLPTELQRTLAASGEAARQGQEGRQGALSRARAARRRRRRDRRLQVAHDRSRRWRCAWSATRRFARR